MPLTAKGSEILKSMEKTYGAKEKAEQVLYASKNAGKITGIDAIADAVGRIVGKAERLGARIDAYCARQDAARSDVSESDIEPRKLFWLRRQRPLPSGKTVRLRVNILWKEKDGRWLSRIVTPGLYQGGNEKVGPEDLES